MMNTQLQQMTPLSRRQSISMGSGPRRARSSYLQVEDDRRHRIEEDLKDANSGWLSSHTPEAEILTKLVHDWEQVSAAVYGYSPLGFAMLVATDRRVLFIRKKFIFTDVDEIPFDSVQGISFDISIFLATVTLHTRIGDFSLKTINFASTERFVDYIDSIIDKQQEVEQERLMYDHA